MRELINGVLTTITIMIASCALLWFIFNIDKMGI